MEFIKELAKKHGLKFDEKRPAKDEDLMTLRKNLIEILRPMNIQTFKTQLEKGGWDLSDFSSDSNKA